MRNNKSNDPFPTDDTLRKSELFLTAYQRVGGFCLHDARVQIGIERAYVTLKQNWAEEANPG